MCAQDGCLLALLRLAHDLPDEPALPDARIRSDDHEVSAPALRGGVEDPAQHRQLGLSPHDRRPGAPAPARGRVGADGEPGVDRSVAPLHLERPERLVADDLGGGRVGRGPDDDLAGRRDRLEPARGVHDITHRRDVTAERADEHLAGVHADAHLQVDAHPSREVRERALHLQPAAHRPLGIVLVRDRRAEDRHELVADDLVDAAPVGRDVGRERTEARVDEPLDLLGVGGLREGREADQVGEDERSRSALVGSADERVPTRGAEAGLGGCARTARGAGHAGKPMGLRRWSGRWRRTRLAPAGTAGRRGRQWRDGDDAVRQRDRAGAAAPPRVGTRRRPDREVVRATVVPVDDRARRQDRGGRGGRQPPSRPRHPLLEVAGVPFDTRRRWASPSSTSTSRSRSRGSPRDQCGHRGPGACAGARVRDRGRS